MAKSRPFGVTVLAILAGLGAVVALIFAARMFGAFLFYPEIRFFGNPFLGAIMWGILGFIYIWLVRMLWNVDPQGWMFLLILSSLNLILAVVSIIGSATLQSVAPALIINGLVLIYCLLPGTKAAFGTAT
jgi:hypothetical protein